MKRRAHNRIVSRTAGRANLPTTDSLAAQKPKPAKAPKPKKKQPTPDPARAIRKARRKQLRRELIAALDIPETDRVPGRPVTITPSEIRVQVWKRHQGKRVLNARGQLLAEWRVILVSALTDAQRAIFTEYQQTIRAPRT